MSIVWDIGEGLSYSKEETNNIVDYLESERLLKHDTLGGGISITHLGIIQAKEQLEVSENHLAPNEPTISVSTKLHLRENLKLHFNEIDIKELCLDLNIEYEDLPGGSRREKIIELINYAEKRGCFQDLLARRIEMRPNAKW